MTARLHAHTRGAQRAIAHYHHRAHIYIYAIGRCRCARCLKRPRGQEDDNAWLMEMRTRDVPRANAKAVTKDYTRLDVYNRA